jgi:hypothetical protein
VLESLPAMLGVMKFETEPLSFEDWRRFLWVLLSWLQDVGGFAMFGMVLWVINALVYPVNEVLPNGKKRNRLVGPWMLTVGAAALCAYLVAGGMVGLLSKESPATQQVIFLGQSITPGARNLVLMLSAAGFLAILAFGGPFVADCFRMSGRRIYAIAKLSFKEAVRRRVVWVFLVILLVYLFPARWFFQVKPEDEVKNIVGMSNIGMNILLVFVGLLIAAFSIPSDIKNLTIHTIITKPVERFEIVLGRFLGYLGLLTAALLLMTGFGLILINTGNISPEASEESLKARVARYGDMEFRSKKESDFQGVDVGREEGYRKFIAGHPNSPQRAIWNFTSLPSGHEEKPAVPLEFAFDIYRSTKGEEGTGVQVTFEMYTHNWDPSKEEEFNQASKGLLNPRPGDSDPAAQAAWKRVSELAEKYGRYRWRSQQIFDYHTVSFPVPSSLLKNAAQGAPRRDEAIQGNPLQPLRRLQVQVQCETPSQFVGVAK